MNLNNGIVMKKLVLHMSFLLPSFSSVLWVLMQNLTNNMFVVGFMVVQKLIVDLSKKKIVNLRIKLVLQE
jgi:hypothetical protein